MSGKHQSRAPPPSSSSASPSSSASSPSSAKLPKFFQKTVGRDRSRSMSTDPNANSTSSLGPPQSPATDSPRKSTGSRFGRPKPLPPPPPPSHTEDQPPLPRLPSASASDGLPSTPRDESPPVILEPPSASASASASPVPIPRSRPYRTQSPPSPLRDEHSMMSASTPAGLQSPNSRLSDLPTRLSGWFSHTFSSSSTDLSLPALLSQSQSQSQSQHQGNYPASPRSGKGGGPGGPNPLLTVAKHGKGHLEKAMRYILDSDATPDQCTDPIWLLGVLHPGYEPATPPLPPPPLHPRHSGPSTPPAHKRQGSPSALRSSTSSSGASTSTSSLVPPGSYNHTLSSSSSGGSSSKKDPASNWPPVFYADFTSRVWLTYRSHFQAIRDTTLAALEDAAGADGTMSISSSPSSSRRWWGGEKGWTSDTGWGCMLRTGQSLLANSLLHLHLGRDWRRPPHPVPTSDYATYVQMLTWFLDSPSALCPFSVHRMALAGKDLGKDVGQWFGPSTAAGAIKTLVHAFPDAGLGVSVAVDSVVYETDVFAASHESSRSGHFRRASHWGSRAVVVLIGLRLGLDGVNPIYYDTIKELYTWPQSVGIAGGRPSSSYYFVGSQADCLFYLDPHHARPAIPLRPPPNEHGEYDINTISSSSDERHRTRRGGGSVPPTAGAHMRSPTSPTPSASSTASTRSRSAFFSRPQAAAVPLVQQLSSSSAPPGSGSSSSHGHAHTRWSSTTPQLPCDSPDEALDPRELEVNGEGLDPIQLHYVQAYSAAELKTFHCDRVRKMPLSGLDPSMLLGFLCRDEADWKDLRLRVANLSKKHKTIFTIQDEPPRWPSESDVDVESIDEPDIDMPEDDDEGLLDADADPDADGDGDADDFFDANSAAAPSRMSTSRSPSTSPDPDLPEELRKAHGHEVDTEEDTEAPVTPGPHRHSFDPDAAYSAATVKSRQSSRPVHPQMQAALDASAAASDDIEDDWVDPISSPSSASSPAVSPPPITHSHSHSSSASTTELSDVPTSASAAGTKKKKKKSRKESASAVVDPGRTPMPASQQPQQHFPFPVSIRHADDSFENAAQEVELEPSSESEQQQQSPQQQAQQQQRPRTVSKRTPQMRTARARDGGRTQSGGVRAIPTTDDGDDF